MLKIPRDDVIRVLKATREVERRIRNDSPGEGRWQGRTTPEEMILGVLDAGLSRGSSATASVWEWNGASFADANRNVTVYDWLLKIGSDPIAAGKRIIAREFGAVYVVVEAECP